VLRVLVGHGRGRPRERGHKSVDLRHMMRLQEKRHKFGDLRHMMAFSPSF
jgi:hypothetical protein